MPPFRTDKREGRNVCISSRITDAEDDLIDKIVKEENDSTPDSNMTRSKIVSKAIGDYLKKKKIGNNHIIIEVEKDEDGILVGFVPSIPGCHTQGETIDELIANLKEAIEVSLDI